MDTDRLEVFPSDASSQLTDKTTATQQLPTLARQELGADRNSSSISQTSPHASLSEDPNSEFAKVVDEIARGKTINLSNSHYIKMGTRLDALKMIRLPDVKVTFMSYF